MKLLSFNRDSIDWSSFRHWRSTHFVGKTNPWFFWSASKTDVLGGGGIVLPLLTCCSILCRILIHNISNTKYVYHIWVLLSFSLPFLKSCLTYYRAPESPYTVCYLSNGLLVKVCLFWVFLTFRHFLFIFWTILSYINISFVPSHQNEGCVIIFRWWHVRGN